MRNEDGRQSPVQSSMSKSVGVLFNVGSPETVARKVVRLAKSLPISRFDMKYSVGTLPHEKLMRSIELYGTKVAPMVRHLSAAEPVSGKVVIYPEFSHLP